jgi:ubiquitin carboxyl-terminal hydrolase L5
MDQACSEPAAGDERRRSSRIRVASSTPSETTEKNIPQKRGNSVENSTEPTSPQRTLRKRKSDVPNGAGSDPIEESMKPLQNEERQDWKGWVELESDPVCHLPSFLSS